MSSFETDEEFLLTEYEQASSEGEFCYSGESSDISDDNDPRYTPETQLSFDLPNLGIHEIETPIEGSKKRGISEYSASAKRLRVWSNHTLKSTKDCIPIKYIGEIDSRISLATFPIYKITDERPRYLLLVSNGKNAHIST